MASQLMIGMAQKDSRLLGITVQYKPQEGPEKLPLTETPQGEKISKDS